MKREEEWLMKGRKNKDEFGIIDENGEKEYDSSYSTTIHIPCHARLKTHARELIRLAIQTQVKTYNECGSAPFVSDFLVKSCLQMKRLDGSIEIVRMLMSKGINPQVTTCNALILKFSKCHGENEGYEVYKKGFTAG
ncbi:hypothetical protein GQ457_09G007900 [Hibiscus cannabinus]